MKKLKRFKKVVEHGKVEWVETPAFLFLIFGLIIHMSVYIFFIVASFIPSSEIRDPSVGYFLITGTILLILYPLFILLTRERNVYWEEIK